LKTQTKPISRGIAIHRSIVPGPNTRTIQSRIASRPTPSQRTSVSGISNTRAPQAAAGPANRNASQPNANQLRGVTQRVAANALNQRGPIRPASPLASKTPRYNVQTPIPLAGGSQQIRATIPGTPQIAGSVELSKAGAGRVYISNLKVDQQHRRRGVAAKLIDAAVSAARRQGFRAVSLEARPSDNGISPQALVAMYRRQGFESVGKSQRGSPLMERKL
jgi:ribosomal protein S18 acetylase RimI-like enzyme